MEDILRKLVAFPSVAGNTEAIHDLLSYVATYLRQRGMYVEWFENGGHESIVATIKPGEKHPRVLLGAHVDVVDAPAELFQLQNRDGKYIGRGVLDMKCTIAAYMQTVDTLRSELQDYDFGIMLTSDEELGGQDGINGVVHLIDQGYLPKALVLPDGGQNWQIETASNGYAHFSLLAGGRTAHSSRPWEGDSAAFKIVRALHDIQKLFNNSDPKSDTLNIATIQTDGPINRIPDNAKAELSIRLVKPGGLAKYEKLFTKICTKHSVKLIMRAGWDPTFNDLDNPYVRRYAEITEEVTNVKVGGFQSFAGSDARFFAELGVPYANAYPKGGGHHSDQEWLAEESLEQLGAIIQQYIREVASKDNELPAATTDKPAHTAAESLRRRRFRLTLRR